MSIWADRNPGFEGGFTLEHVPDERLVDYRDVFGVRAVSLRVQESPLQERHLKSLNQVAVHGLPSRP